MSSSEPLLSVERLSAAWGPTDVLRSVSLEVADREYFVLLGPNGSGKTTLLRCLAGLERPRGGRIALAGEDLADRPPHRRGIGLMFQEPALFAHRSVYENIAYAPLIQRLSRSAVDTVVGQMLDLLRLAPLADRRPEALSGGERQRVALARTLAARPRLVLLDEPFASIDPELKQELRTDFRRALTALGTAAIHVTHDREEGLYLADRLGLLFDGTLATVGPPREVYEHPTSARAARFLGYNVVAAPTGWVAVEPRDLLLSTEPGGGVPMVVEGAGPVGRENVVVLRTHAGERVEARLAGSEREFLPGRTVYARWERSVPLGSGGLEGSHPKEPKNPRFFGAP